MEIRPAARIGGDRPWGGWSSSFDKTPVNRGLCVETGLRRNTLGEDFQRFFLRRSPSRMATRSGDGVLSRLLGFRDRIGVR